MGGIIGAFLGALGGPRGSDGESGQSLAEYGLLLTLVAVGAGILAVAAFGVELARAFESATACMGGSC